MPHRYVVSELASVSWREGEVLIASPVRGVTLTTADASLLAVLSAFATPREIEDVAAGSPDLAARINEWIAAAILVEADSPEREAVQHWDRHSLALHASARELPWRRSRGRTTPPAIAPRRSEERIPLAPGPAVLGRAGRSDLAALLDARRTRRLWASTPIGFRAFSDLFWLSARNRAEPIDGHVSRPYPSAGAAYSLELYPVLAEEAVETLPAGVYRYLPEAHALEVVSPFGPSARPFLEAAGSAAGAAPPPVTILITSRYARQSATYTRIAYTLVLKEVGCLFQTLYLAAEALGLAACALGGGTPRGLLADLCGTSELEEPLVGEFALGAAAD